MSFNLLDCNYLNASVNINTPNTNSNNVNAFNVNTTTINGSPYPPPAGSGVTIAELESGAGLPINFTPFLSTPSTSTINASNGLLYNAQNGSLEVNSIDFDLNTINAGAMGIYTAGASTDILVRNTLGGGIILDTANSNSITINPTQTVLAASSGINNITASNQSIVIQNSGGDTSRVLNLINNCGGNVLIGAHGTGEIHIQTANGSFGSTPVISSMVGPAISIGDTTNSNTISSNGSGVNITSTNGFNMTNNSDTLISNGSSFQMQSPNPIGITGTGVLIANGTNGDAIVTNVAGISITTTVGLTIEPPAGVGSAGMVLTNLGAGACAWQSLGTSFNTSTPSTIILSTYTMQGIDFSINKILVDTYAIGAHNWTAPLATDLNIVFPSAIAGFTVSLFISNSGGQDLTIDPNTGTTVVGRDLIGISGAVYARAFGDGSWVIYY